MGSLSLNPINNLSFYKSSPNNPNFGSKQESFNAVLEHKSPITAKIATNLQSVQIQYKIIPFKKQLAFGESKAYPLPLSSTGIRENLAKLLKSGKIKQSDYDRIINGKSEISNLLANNPNCSLSSNFEDFLLHFLSSRKCPALTTFEGDFFTYQYTAWGFLVINEALRKETDLSEEFKIFKKGLNKALNKLPNYTGTVYRGISAFDEAEKLEVGDAYNPKEFLSTSKNMKFPNLYQFVIKAQNGKSISEIARYPSEEEVLFKSNSRFKILGIEKETATADISFKTGNNLSKEQLKWLNKEREKAKANCVFDGKITTYYMEEI